MTLAKKPHDQGFWSETSSWLGVKVDAMAGSWFRTAWVLVVAPVFGGTIVTAQDERTAAPPAYVLDARRIRAVFQDLLGRPPVLVERQEWEGRVDAECS